MLFEKAPDNNEKLALRAEELFGKGFNCCESMIKASIEVLELPLPQDTYLMGRFFRRGVAESGCICGALAGGIMMMGFVAGRDQKNLSLAEAFRKEFMDKFGSSCCRVIRKKQSMSGRFMSRECKQITKFAAGKLQEIIESQKGPAVNEEI